MGTKLNLFIFFAVLTLILIFLFNLVSELKIQKNIESKNKVCIYITEQLNTMNVSESSSCVKYYCYYAPYIPPKGYENITETLCICDCKKIDGSIMSHQILTPALTHH